MKTPIVFLLLLLSVSVVWSQGSGPRPLQRNGSQAFSIWGPISPNEMPDSPTRIGVVALKNPVTQMRCSATIFKFWKSSVIECAMVTNAHCVKDSRAVRIEDLSIMDESVRPQQLRATIYQAVSVLQTNNQMDLAELALPEDLRVKYCDGGNGTTKVVNAKLARQSELATDAVAIFGFPFGWPRMFTAGLVWKSLTEGPGWKTTGDRTWPFAGFALRERLKTLVEELPYLIKIYDLRSKSSMSGGAAIDQQNNLIGINVASAKSGFENSVIIPIADVVDFVLRKRHCRLTESRSGCIDSRPSINFRQLPVPFGQTLMPFEGNGLFNNDLDETSNGRGGTGNGRSGTGSQSTTDDIEALDQTLSDGTTVRVFPSTFAHQSSSLTDVTMNLKSFLIAPGGVRNPHNPDEIILAVNDPQQAIYGYGDLKFYQLKDSPKYSPITRAKNGDITDEALRKSLLQRLFGSKLWSTNAKSTTPLLKTGRARNFVRWKDHYFRQPLVGVPTLSVDATNPTDLKIEISKFNWYNPENRQSPMPNPWPTQSWDRTSGPGTRWAETKLRFTAKYSPDGKMIDLTMHGMESEILKCKNRFLMYLACEGVKTVVSFRFDPIEKVLEFSLAHQMHADDPRSLVNFGSRIIHYSGHLSEVP